MMDSILYQHHIMWYESKMIWETLDSLEASIRNSKLKVHLKFCLNSQTYLETPIEGRADDMFAEFLQHSVLKNAEIVYKTDKDAFYNIGDWRREIYDKKYKYTVWGESDCLIPVDFFYILSEVQIPTPHLLSFASRKMWDKTWANVEHINLSQYNTDKDAPFPLSSGDVINQSQLNQFNSKWDIEIGKITPLKIDGSLLCISGGIDFQFIPDDMNFVREDYCAQLVFQHNEIPQYVAKTRLKGHNYSHPLKRTNTHAKRTDEAFKQYEMKSTKAMNNFIKSLI
jgi:hypothetical protein